jgi:RNA polymerase sigma-70 factor (ECF subfamily)
LTEASRAPAPDPPDAELIERFRRGDGDAFSMLVARHEGRVHSIAYRMLGRSEEARDAAQDAFLSCFRHLDKFRGDAAFGTWLYRITVNACHDILRKRHPEPRTEEEGLVPPPSPDHADQAVATVDVQRALLLVPLEFRAVLVMHDGHGLPYEEIAQTLEIPLGTVKSRLHRGRVALGRVLAGEPAATPAASKPEMP